MTTGNGAAEPPLKTDLELRVGRLEIKTAHHDALIKAEQNATRNALLETKRHMTALHEDATQLIGQLGEKADSMRGAIADVSRALAIVARDLARQRKQPAKRRRKGKS